jgi:hypothetical protein
MWSHNRRHKLVASLIEALPGGGATTGAAERGGGNVMGGMAQRLHAESDRVGADLMVAHDRGKVLRYARTQWTSMLDMMRGEHEPQSSLQLRQLWHVVVLYFGHQTFEREWLLWPEPSCQW